MVAGVFSGNTPMFRMPPTFICTEYTQVYKPPKLICRVYSPVCKVTSVCLSKASLCLLCCSSVSDVDVFLSKIPLTYIRNRKYWCLSSRFWVSDIDTSVYKISPVCVWKDKAHVHKIAAMYQMKKRKKAHTNKHRFSQHKWTWAAFWTWAYSQKTHLQPYTDNRTKQNGVAV